MTLLQKTLTLLFGAPTSKPPSAGGSIFVILPDSWVRPKKPFPRVEEMDDKDWALAIAWAIAEWYGLAPAAPLPKRTYG